MSTPGLKSYVVGTLAAFVLSRAVVELFHLGGRADVALTIACLAAVIYALTPAYQRGQAKRLWGMVFLSIVSLIAGSAAAAVLGMAAGLPSIFTAMAAGEATLGLAFTYCIALVGGGFVYFAVFRWGWPLVQPRDEPAEPFRLY
jgi:hypothetical protein